MRKALHLFRGIFACVLVTLIGFANASAADVPRGSIRGGVYEDLNGNGECVAGQHPVPGVDISFHLFGPELTLYTGSDGTYGLVAAGQGVWEVMARPSPTEWEVTSSNPIIVQVNSNVGLVQTDIDFCVKRAGVGTASAVEPAITSYADVLKQLDSFGTTDLPTISEALLTAHPGQAPSAVNSDEFAISTTEFPTPAAVWLTYLNLFRQMGGLQPLVESEPLTYGSQLHSRYMVVNDRPIAHSENVNNPLYDPAGQDAAKNGNIFATTQIEADSEWAINFWVSAPFHLVPMLDPSLGLVGFGRHNQEIGTFHMAAVLDVRSEIGRVDSQTQYPLLFPADGAETWVVRHSLYEWPDPLTSCSGYRRPTGAPIVLQLGEGDLTPSVAQHSLRMGDQVLESCLFDETSYLNPDPYAQQTGRIILNERDAAVIMPRYPLAIDQSYTVAIDVNGQQYTWSFSTRQKAP